MRVGTRGRERERQRAHADVRKCVVESCSTLQYVAVRCIALQYVTVCCSVFVVCCSVFVVCCDVFVVCLQCICWVFAMCCSVLQCVCSVLQHAAMYCRVLQRVAVCLQCVAECCNVLQCAAVCCDGKSKDVLEKAKDCPSFNTGNTHREKTASLRAKELDAQSKAQDTLIVNPPPLRGDFFVGWVRNQAPGARGPPLKYNPNFPQKLGLFFSGSPLAPGSWFGNHLDKKPPPGGGASSINVF